MLYYLIDVLKLVEDDCLYKEPRSTGPDVASQPPLPQFLSPTNVMSNFQPLAMSTQISSSEPSFLGILNTEVPSFLPQLSTAQYSPQILSSQPPETSSQAPSMSSHDQLKLVKNEWEFGEYCNFLCDLCD